MSVSGFSKLSKEEKINWLATNHFQDGEQAVQIIKQYWNADKALQKLHDEFIENTISNFYLPLGIAPNFVINEKEVTIPMAIEESSVVAAASKAAKFWSKRGGFKATVLNTEKIGQVHFNYTGERENLYRFFEEIKTDFYTDTDFITQNMKKRGGGILDIVLKDKTTELANYYQIHVTFNTADSMGANFINTCLEQIAKTLKTKATQVDYIQEAEIDVVMSILSNYVPNCIVRAEVSCHVDLLTEDKNTTGRTFAEKFVQAVKIAEIEPYRAVTHNKGIMNGIDAVVIASGNDFRAIEACAHAYAAKSGQYSSLSHAEIKGDIFHFWMDIPLALGTVGGLTSLHPLVKIALQIMDNPNAKELMQIIAVAGLAQNYAALRSLTTSGIQKGHMKMHLMNILNQFNATDSEKIQVVNHFENTTVTHAAVVDFINQIRA